ncbi:MAG: sodium:solute symporter family transporter [Ignavibacteria bacterium]
MKNIYLFLSVLFYVIGIFILTVLGKRKKQSIESFSIGSKTVSPVVVGLSLAVGMTSAATFVINPRLIYLYGFSGFLGYGIAAPLGIYIALIVMSKSFLRFGEQTKVLTVPQWIGERYQNKLFTIFYALISLLQITFAVLIAVGITIVLANYFNASYELVLILVLLFSVTYLFFGGGVNVLLFSNAFQSFFMIVTAILFLISGPVFLNLNPIKLFDELRNINPNLISFVNPQSLLFRDLFEVFIANFLIGVAIICQPHIIAKALYLKSEKDLSKYLVSVIIVSSLFFFVLFTGLYARVALGNEILKPDQAISKYINFVFPPILMAIVTLGILSAGFSTLDNILVSLSSIFSVNILKEILVKVKSDLNENKLKNVLLISSKLFLIALAVVIYFLSINQIYHPNLSVAIFAQNGVYGLFVTTFWPIMLGLYKSRISKYSVFFASLIALITHFGFYYLEITKYHNNPGVTAAFALIFSGAFVLITTIFSRIKK